MRWGVRGGRVKGWLGLRVRWKGWGMLDQSVADALSVAWSADASRHRRYPCRYPKLRDTEWLREQIAARTLEDIASEVGCTRERVRQIVKRDIGIAIGDVRRTRGLIHTPQVRKRAEIVAVMASEMSLSDTEIAQRLGLSKSMVAYSRKPKGIQNALRAESAATREILAKLMESGMTASDAGRQVGIRTVYAWSLAQRMGFRRVGGTVRNPVWARVDPKEAPACQHA